MVAKCGSFSDAASELNLTQPAVTARVQRLEFVLKTQLLDRKPRGVICTPAGKRLFDAGEAALRDLRQLANSLVQEAEGRRNVVTVASTPWISSRFLSPLLRDFSQRSTLSIEIRDMDHADVFAAVQDGSVDLAVSGLDEEDPSFAMKRFGELDFVAVAPADSPLFEKQQVGFEDLAPFVIVLMHDYARLNARIQEEFDARHLTPKLRKARNFTTILAMVNSGLGIAFAPRAALRDATYPNVRELPLENFDYVRPLWLICQPNKPLRNSASVFWDFLRDTGLPV